MSNIMQFIFVVSFVILAYIVLDTRGMPEKCYPPEYYDDPRCRALTGRYFYDEDEKDCHRLQGCWDINDGFFNKKVCKRLCKE
uniref:Putative salivary protein n=1 Tax=Ixodes ricinus TaxID=34613 RepID=A0A090XBX9_IXORI